MLDRRNFTVGAVSSRNIRVVKPIIYLQILKTYLDLNTSIEHTNNVTRSKAIPLHYRSRKNGIEIWVPSSPVKSISVGMTTPGSLLGIGLEVKVGINVNLMVTHFVE